MSDYSDVPTIYTGDWIDAAWLNQYVGDNFRALKQGVANAGDMPYALDANTLAALAKPSVDSLMAMASAGVPSWLAKAAVPGRLHTKGFSFTNSGDNTTSTSYVAIGTGLKVSLTLTQTCTVIGIAFGAASKGSASAAGYFKLKIDGTIDPNENVQFRNTLATPFSTFYYRTGIAAGTRDVELMYRTGSGADALTLASGAVLALAFVDG